MKSTFLITTLCLAGAASLPAGQLVQEAEASYNASAGARTNLGRRNGDVSEQNTHFQYLLSYSTPSQPIARLGVGYDRFDFAYAGPGIIPGNLQSLSLVAGLDLKIGDVLIRVESQPGFYGSQDGFNSGNFNVPVVVGASYLVSKDFQWIGGISINPNSSSIVMGGVGFRWKIADQWVLNFVPPNPRVEFKATDDLTFYAGGQLVTSTFRVNDLAGSRRRGSRFDNALVDYTEIRTGAGASWKLGGKGTLDLELGYMAYRDFDYHKLNENYESKSGAIYGQAGFKLNF